MDTATIREQARQFLAFARERNVTKLDALVDVDGDKTRFIIERTAVTDDDEQSTMREQVTVKTGPVSKPKTVVALPGEWL